MEHVQWAEMLPFHDHKEMFSHRSVFYCELERTLVFFTPSQLKGEYRSRPLPSTFPSTVISQKIQSAGLISQPLICLLPHIPAFSPTDPFIPSLHVHLQGKAWSPSPGAPASSHVCPYSHHRHAPGLPALVPAGFLPVSTGQPWQPGSFSLWCHGSRNYSQPHLLRVSHLHTPTASPLPTALSTMAEPACLLFRPREPAFCPGGEPLPQPRPPLPKHRPLSSTLASLLPALAADPQSPFPLFPGHTAT